MKLIFNKMTILGLHLTFFRFLLIFLALDTFKWSKMDVSTINKVKKWANILLKKEMGTTKKKPPNEYSNAYEISFIFLEWKLEKVNKFCVKCAYFRQFSSRNGAVCWSAGGDNHLNGILHSACHNFWLLFLLCVCPLCV